jgi:hypothetical protein
METVCEDGVKMNDGWKYTPEKAEEKGAVSRK